MPVLTSYVTQGMKHSLRATASVRAAMGTRPWLMALLAPSTVCRTPCSVIVARFAAERRPPLRSDDKLEISDTASVTSMPDSRSKAALSGSSVSTILSTASVRLATRAMAQIEGMHATRNAAAATQIVKTPADMRSCANAAAFWGASRPLLLAAAAISVSEALHATRLPVLARPVACTVHVVLMRQGAECLAPARGARVPCRTLGEQAVRPDVDAPLLQRECIADMDLNSIVSQLFGPKLHLHQVPKVWSFHTQLAKPH